MGREADALPSGDVDGFDGFDGLAAAGRGDAIALQQFLDAGAGDIWRYLEMDAAGNMETYWKHSHHYWKYNLPIFANYGNGNEMELPLLSRCFESSFSVILCCHVEMSH